MYNIHSSFITVAYTILSFYVYYVATFPCLLPIVLKWILQLYRQTFGAMKVCSSSRIVACCKPHFAKRIIFKYHCITSVFSDFVSARFVFFSFRSIRCQRHICTQSRTYTFCIIINKYNNGAWTIQRLFIFFPLMPYIVVERYNSLSSLFSLFCVGYLLLLRFSHTSARYPFFYTYLNSLSCDYSTHVFFLRSLENQWVDMVELSE